MKIKITSNLFSLLLLCFIFNSCTEPYILETNTYEEALVVEATITNELKKQEITITKTSRFEDKETQIEKGADVFITDNTGTRYHFEEESGKYISTIEFQAIPGKEYRLNINTKDGRTIVSTTETLSAINPMQDVKAAVETKDSLRGVAIRVSSYDPTNTAKYYRFEYEETYKIIAPEWRLKKAITIDGVNGANPTLEVIANDPNTRICYSTKKNTEIILTSTNELNEDRVDFVPRFISDQNYIISHRYCILVKQYVENLPAYTYYKTLKKISGTESILSPLQPGFLNGNLKSVNNPNDKIMGYFDVASVSSKRIYFNYIDLFPKDPPPPYYTKCDEQALLFCFGPPPCYGDELVYYFANNLMTYSLHEGILYHIYPAPCGDCTTFSSNIKPPFWVD
ncbi:DUF4249 domain-containing protein [Flavobacterium aquariorum]|uniref:DUF4249 domain-containing protein n=1 Tax=Flavobacterium aquariorum TaxID=2217670 RepID=A0A2W7TW06_9FLAO|nr:DUF4249 domain-containing protein [Flavobacterium aquariorum]PZX93714.1 DUF4249 domain-containing protein [Flavobacterium aquariorum]